jgi:hypothetical protein
LKSNRTCIRQHKSTHPRFEIGPQPPPAKENTEQSSAQDSHPVITSDRPPSAVPKTYKTIAGAHSTSPNSESCTIDDNPQQPSMRRNYPDLSPIPDVDFSAFEDANAASTTGVYSLSCGVSDVYLLTVQ